MDNMVIEHICNGNKQTTLHTFVLSQNGMAINVSPGTYTQQNITKYTTATGATLTLSPPAAQTYYEIWLNNVGLVVLSRTDGQQFGSITNPIDRLAWFAVPANTTTLDAVNIDVVKMLEVS
jgi:hypothetical protein